MSQSSEHRRARIAQLTWEAQAEPVRQAMAATVSQLLGVTPAEIDFLDYHETKGLMRVLASFAAPVRHMPTRQAAVEYVESEFRHVHGTTIVSLCRPTGDFGLFRLPVEQVLLHLDGLLRVSDENLWFVASDLSYGLLLGYEEAVDPDAPRWVEVWHDAALAEGKANEPKGDR